MHDCCGFCPEPESNEDREIAEEESKIYVSGDVTFMKDDPGRQAIGSFNPLTDDDWTDMAYIGNTQELCQKICESDLDFVKAWCKKNPDSIDRRDISGKTPLHVAVQSSTPDIVECLVNHGARLVARLVDGMTALHIAAARGNSRMVTILLTKSEENEALEAEKEEKKAAAGRDGADLDSAISDTKPLEDDSDEDMEDASSDDDTTMTEGSFVKVSDKKPTDEDALDGKDASEPDIYDVNVVAWDNPVSPLHLAIMGGHIETIKTLVSNFGANVLLPIKLVNSYDRSPRSAIMTLILAAQLSGTASTDVTKALLSLGASSAQADMQKISTFHYLVAKQKVQLLKACVEHDAAATKSALDHIVMKGGWMYGPKAITPLTTAISSNDSETAEYLLDCGAKPTIGLDEFVSAYDAAHEGDQWNFSKRDKDLSEIFKTKIEQPIFTALAKDMVPIVTKLLEAGVDVNTLNQAAYDAIANFEKDKDGDLSGSSLLDAINDKIAAIDAAVDAASRDVNQGPNIPEPIAIREDETYLEGIAQDSYEAWHISKLVYIARSVVAEWPKVKVQELERSKNKPGRQQRVAALESLRDGFSGVKDLLLRRGAKTLKELYPNILLSSTEKKDEKKSRHVKDFEPKVTFKTSSSDRVRDGYLQL